MWKHGLCASLRAQAKQSSLTREKILDCFVAHAPLRKRLAFVAGNDGNLEENKKSGETPGFCLSEWMQRQYFATTGPVNL